VVARPVIAVVGGGVSGLAAARVLAGGSTGASARDLADITPPGRTTMSATSDGDGAGGGVGPGDLDVLVLEAAAELGGKVTTGTLGGEAVELGPDQFLRRDPSAERLCTELGLGPLLHPPAALRAAVYSYGKLRPFPAGLVLGVPTDLDAVAATGAVSDEGVRRASLDATLPGPELTEADLGLAGDDPALERSAGALLRARFGDELVDRLVDPLLGGINAGGLDTLSLGTVAPQIARALLGHHDVMAPLRRSMVEAAGGAGAAAGAAGGAPGGAAGGAAGGAGAAGTPPPSPFLGIEGGLGQLVTVLANDLRARGVELRTASPVSRLTFDGGSLRLSTPDGEIDVDGVVLALPAPSLGGIVEQLAPHAAATLVGIPYSSVAVVTLAFDESSVRFPEGLTGLVVPRVEGRLTTAVTFLSQKWPWIGSGGRAVVRISAGRYRDPRALDLADDALVVALRAELSELAGIDAVPRHVHVHRWVGAFPQYLPGHAARIAQVREELARTPSVSLAGALLGGIGIPACITSGEQAALGLLASLG
jgi:oxygen-dependent protoporphyrinogen oxidase